MRNSLKSENPIKFLGDCQLSTCFGEKKISTSGLNHLKTDGIVLKALMRIA